MLTRPRLEKILLTVFLAAATAAAGAYRDVQILKDGFIDVKEKAERSVTVSRTNSKLLCLIAIRVSKPEDKNTLEEVCLTQ